jgi:hypothetical protein
MKKFLILATLLVIAASWSINAQQPEPTLKPSMSAPRAEGPPPLLLEIVFNAALPPGYANVNGPTKLGKWIAISNFVRVPASTPLSPPVQWVKVEPQFNGETVAVRVTLLRGVQGAEQEDFVGIYRLGIGEKKKLNELRAVGIEPFTITLIDTVPPLPPPPAFVNDTKAVEIVSVRSENSPNPAYILTLRNLSDKNVWGVGFDMTFDGRSGGTGFLANDDDRPLIPAGGVVEKQVRAMKAERTATGFVPSTPSAVTVHIRSAVFSDLSYEGDVKDACNVEKTAIGERVYLTEVLSLLDKQLAATFVDNVEAVRQFKEKFEALRYYDDYSEKPSTISPACTNMVQGAVNTVNVMKLEMLRDLNQIITTQPRPPFSFRAWMETRRENYKNWLARL